MKPQDKKRSQEAIMKYITTKELKCKMVFNGKAAR